MSSLVTCNLYMVAVDHSESYATDRSYRSIVLCDWNALARPKLAWWFSRSW